MGEDPSEEVSMYFSFGIGSPLLLTKLHSTELCQEFSPPGPHPRLHILLAAPAWVVAHRTAGQAGTGSRSLERNAPGQQASGERKCLRSGTSAGWRKNPPARASGRVKE